MSLKLLISADRFRPSKLDENGLAVREPCFIGATSRLMLWRSSTGFANSAETFEMPFSQNCRPSFDAGLLVA